MPATLAITHAATPAAAVAGETVTYAVTVANDDLNAVNGIAFSDAVPAGVTDVTWTAAESDGASVSTASGAGNVIAEMIDLPRSSSVTFTVTGRASSAAVGMTLVHAASITPPSGISNQGNVSASASVTVVPAATAVSLASSANPSTFGAPVVFTAAVSAVPPGAVTPTGFVTFMDGASALGTSALAGGVATFATSSLPVGTGAITAAYGGDAACLGATSPGLSQTVGRSAVDLALVASPSPSAFGDPVSLAATVTGPGATATGLVTFQDGGAMLGTASLAGGVATIDVPLLAIGTHAITATYGGDEHFEGGGGAALLDVAHSDLCLVQTDCLADDECVTSTRRGGFGLCQKPAGTSASLLGCSTSAGGAPAALLALALALAARRRPASKR
jgi:uncharacterized repeat protein (TIGR01451 family)/MYXO-CTERM domain-containing protein